MQKAIAIDFDGTLCTNDYPDIGEPNWEIIAEAKMEQAHGIGMIAPFEYGMAALSIQRI